MLVPADARASRDRDVFHLKRRWVVLPEGRPDGLPDGLPEGLPEGLPDSGGGWS